jgi:hypothetical protein
LAKIGVIIYLVDDLLELGGICEGATAFLSRLCGAFGDGQAMTARANAKATTGDFYKPQSQRF